MSKIVRVGVTFPPDLLKDFDEIITRWVMKAEAKPSRIQ
jgi:metal-responsive CopG/Arc/MetJ family transcriptional regulator